MNRREILKNIFKAAIAGAAMGALEGAAKAAGLNKYATMVRLQQDVIAFHTLMKDKVEGPVYLNPQYQEVMNPKIDTLLSFSMENFAGDYKSKEAFEECRKMFADRNYMDTMTEEGLRKILEVVIPVAVMRHLLAFQRISFNPTGMKSWDDFVDRYQKMILAS